MTAERYFTRDWNTARAGFRAACQTLHRDTVQVGTTSHFGRAGEAVIEIARLGDPRAPNLLVVCGGDRLADALCCSGIETAWLSEFGAARLPPGTGIVLMHHGAAPATGGEIPPDDQPRPQWNSDLLAKVEERYAAYAREKHVDHLGAPLQVAAGEGDVSGFSSGILDLAARPLEVAAKGRLVFLDIAVGLGPFGEAEITACHPPGSAGAARVAACFGLRPPGEDEGEAEHSSDSLTTGLMRRFPQAEVTAARAAFGTYSMKSVLDTLAARDDSRQTPDPRRLLFPDSPEWCDAVWHSAVVVIQRALSALHHR